MTNAEIRETNKTRAEAYELLRSEKYKDSLNQFLSVFDGVDPHVAHCIGYIYANKRFAGHDPLLAISYLNIAADSDDAGALNALGDVYATQGDPKSAMEQYRKAAAAGDAEASYRLYGIQWRQSERTAAIVDLRRAAEMKHPPAITTLAILSIEGRFGISRIVPGLVAYVRNIPNVVCWVKKTYPVKPSSRHVGSKPS